MLDRTNPQPITGETFSAMSANKEDGARSDIAADGFWGGRFERTFFDVRVFNCHAPSNQTPTLSSCYMKTKEENASFEFVRLSGHHSPQLSSPLLEASATWPLLPTNGAHHTVRPWGGFAAVYPFPFCDHPYSASEEHDQIKDMRYTPPSIELAVSESMIPLSI